MALSAPKLIAEMLKTLALYGCVQSGPPMVTRKSCESSRVGASEWLSHSYPSVVHVELGAERALLRVALGALVDQRALLARERRGLVVALDEVLADLGADEFEQVAHVPDHGVVAQHRALRLAQVAHADDEPGHPEPRRPRPDAEPPPRQRPEQRQRAAAHHHEVADRDMTIQGDQPGGHGRFQGVAARAMLGRCAGRKADERGVGGGFPRRRAQTQPSSWSSRSR